MSSNSLLDSWWRETSEFKKIISELNQHDIFLLYGPPGIGKNTLINQLKSGGPDDAEKNVCYVNYQNIPGKTWSEKSTRLTEYAREKNIRIIIQATTFDFFEINGVNKTSERKNLTIYTKELRYRIENLKKNLESPKVIDTFYHSLVISHDDAERLLDTIVSTKNLETSLDKDVKKILLRFARISADDGGSLRIEKGKGYYFPILLKEGLLEIRDPAKKSVDPIKLEKFQAKVEKVKNAERVLLPKPHLFPTLDLAFIPFLWDTIQSPKTRLAGKITENFLEFISKKSNPLQKILESVLAGIPVAGIGLAFLFYFVRKDEEDIHKTLARIPPNWKSLPPAKRKAIGESYDGLFGLEKGSTEASFDVISNLDVDELERRIGSVEDEMKALREELKNEIKTLYNLLSQCRPTDISGKKGKWYEKEALDFREELERHCRGFVGRDWLFRELQTWIANPDSRVLLLTGDVGIGKSAIAAHLTVVPEIKGIHFCSRSIEESCRPVAWLQALVCQLALQFPPYREILEQIATPNWNDSPVSLFRNLVSDRLYACKEKLQVEGPLVFVIDGLDEADPSMVTFLLETIPRIPPWIRLVLTSRPDNRVVERFGNAGVTLRHIGAKDAGNLKDVSIYLHEQYRALVQKGILPETPGLQKKLEQRCGGNFQYATVLMKAMGDADPARRVTVEDLGKLPKDLYYLYDLIFTRRFPDPGESDFYERKVRPLLDCLTAAQAPIPESLLITAAGINPPDAYAGFRALSQLLIHDGEGYRLFHKSIEEWLTTDPGHNRFAAYPDEGHRHLADAGLKEVKDLKKTISPYSLRWLPVHLLATGQTDDLAALLANPQYFIPIWNKNNETARKIWVVVERDTPLKMESVYHPVFKNPLQYQDDFLRIVSKLLFLTGHPLKALFLLEYLQKKVRLAGDVNSLQTILGDQANILYSRGSLDDAMALSIEQERLCRESRNGDVLQRSLGDQANILFIRGDLDGAMKLYQEQERLCRELGNSDGLRRSIGNQAVILDARGNLDQAIKLNKEQERICRESGYDDGLQKSLGNQAVFCINRGTPDEAMKLLKEQERICRELGNKESLQRSLSYQSAIFVNRDMPDEAMELLKEQERISRELGNKEWLQRSLHCQANLLHARGDLDGSMALVKEQEVVCRELGNKVFLMRSLCVQANILYARGDLDSSMAVHKEEEAICRELGDKEALQISLNNIALILQDHGDLDGAMDLLKESECLCLEHGNKDLLQAILHNQANILYARRDLDRAMALYKESERICRELGNKNGLQAALGNQALILKDRGDPDGAMALHKEEERICRELGNKEGLQRSLGNQALIVRDRGDLEGAIALHREEESICRELGKKELLAKSLGNRGYLLHIKGDLESAMGLYKEQEQICLESGNNDELQNSLNNQALILKAQGDLQENLGKEGCILRNLGKPDDAMALFKRQETVCRNFGLNDGLQTSLDNQGLILQMKNDLDGAMVLCKEQERICRESGLHYGLQRSLGNQGVISRMRGDLDRAMTLFKEQQNICLDFGLRVDLQTSLGNQGKILLMKGDPDGAMAFFKETEQICRDLNFKDGLQKSFEGQASVLISRNDLDGAISLLREQEQICREHNNQDDLQISLGLQGLVHQQKNDLDRAMALFREQEHISRESGFNDGLQRSLGNQGLLLLMSGDIDNAMVLCKEQERLCREFAVSGLAIALFIQAMVFLRRHDSDKALALFQEAYQNAIQYGFLAFANQINEVIKKMK